MCALELRLGYESIRGGIIGGVEENWEEMGIG